MSISIGNDYFATQYATTKTESKADALTNKLSQAETATDEEMLEVCKEFETYLVEQVFKQMRDVMTDEENQGDYMNQFGDMLYQEYAKNIAESGEIGLAKQLYESMKRNA